MERNEVFVNCERGFFFGKSLKTNKRLVDGLFLTSASLNWIRKIASFQTFTLYTCFIAEYTVSWIEWKRRTYSVCLPFCSSFIHLKSIIQFIWFIQLNYLFVSIWERYFLILKWVQMDDFQLTEPIECKPTLRREGLLSEAHLKARKLQWARLKFYLLKCEITKTVCFSLNNLQTLNARLIFKKVQFKSLECINAKTQRKQFTRETWSIVFHANARY